MKLFKRLLLPLVLLLSVSLASCGISDFLFPSFEISETTDQSPEISETTEEDLIEVNGKYIRLELAESSFEVVFGVETTFKCNKVVNEFNDGEFQIEAGDVTARDLLDNAFDEKLIFTEYPPFGSFLTGIKGYLVTDDTNYISILTNGEYSLLGIDEIVFAGLDNITLILEDIYF